MKKSELKKLIKESYLREISSTEAAAYLNENESTTLKLKIKEKDGLHTFFKQWMKSEAGVNFSWDENGDEATIKFRKNASKKSIDDFKKAIGRSSKVSLNEINKMKKSELRKIIKEEISKVLKEELVDYEGDNMYQIINSDMKMYYKMDVPMDVIKDWADYYFPNTNYDENEYEFETSAREDFLMFLNDEFGSGASRPEWWGI